MTFPQFNFPSAGGGGFTQGFTGTSPVTAGKYMEALKRPQTKEEVEAELLRSFVPLETAGFQHVS